jgi:hypothetical protein
MATFEVVFVPTIGLAGLEESSAELLDTSGTLSVPLQYRSRPKELKQPVGLLAGADAQGEPVALPQVGSSTVLEEEALYDGTTDPDPEAGRERDAVTVRHLGLWTTTTSFEVVGKTGEASVLFAAALYK